MTKRVSIVGAGLGGLATAIRLAKAGFDVTVYEKNKNPGGKMNEYRQGQYRFDTGPSLLTMPFVVDDLFRFTGYKREDFVRFLAVDPVCRYFYRDGSLLDTHANQQHMAQSIADFAPGEEKNYHRYITYCEELYNLAGGVFLFSPIHELRKIITVKNLPLLFKLHKLDAWRTVDTSLRTFFKDDRLIQLFGRYATYNGSDPYQAPATLNIIPHVEYNLGAYYVEGGMYRLVEALVQLCKNLDIPIHSSAQIQKIWHEDGKLKGIILENRQIAFDIVVCNSDVVYTFETMIDGYGSRRQKLQKLEPSLSGMVFLWNINKTVPNLAHHNIFFGSDYRREFEQMFRDKIPAEDPTIYIAITCRRDKTHAPAGCENWFILVNMPYITDRQNWPEHVNWVRKQILTRLEAMDIRVAEHIEEETVFTPESFHDIYGANRGSIYGLSSNSQFSAFLRPPNRSRDINGLYFASGSTHPGGGIPLVLLSGKLTAEMIMERHG